MPIRIMNWEIRTEWNLVCTYKMKILIKVLIIMIFQIACNPNNEGKLPPPAKVIMVEKFSDLGNTERGIDAVPERDGIKIEWYLLDDPDITHYNIHRKVKVGKSFSTLTSIPVGNDISPFDTVYSYIDYDKMVLDNSDSLYYYFVTSTNKDGINGPNSDTLSYMLLSKPLTEDIANINSNEQPVFKWYFQSELPPNYYIIRIENVVADTLVWARRFLNVGLGRVKEHDLSTVVVNPPVFRSGSLYRWRIDAVGPDSLYSGSESNWKTIIVN